MSEETLEVEEEESPETPAAPEGQDPEVERLRRQNRELLAEVKAQRQKDREGFLREHPWLGEEDIKGQNIGALRNLLAKAPQGASQSQEQAVEEPDPAVAQAAQQAKDFATHGQALQGGTPATGGETISTSEALRRLAQKEWSQAEFDGWKKRKFV